MSESHATPAAGTTATEDSLRLYLSQIGRFPLLTRAEEVQLAKRVEAGDPTARGRMVECNLRLVVTIAKGYRTCALELLDLVQEGTLGLMKAVERYDWRRGTKFSTYAAWWIRSAVIEAIGANASAIRIPESVRERASAVLQAERDLTARMGRRPTTAELCAELELTPGQLAEARASLQPAASLDEPVAAEGDVQHADLLADPNAVDPLEALVDDAAEGEIAARLARLPERSRQVLELRFGLADTDSHTADEVAQKLGVARERVRQIELNALRRLAA
jgi:RNA polymerase primary sigma factor